MKQILTILIFFSSLACSSQVKQEYNQYGGLWKRLSLRWNGGFQLPRSAVSTKDLNVATLDTAQLWYNPSDSSIYFHTGFQNMKILNTADTSNKWVNWIQKIGDSTIFWIGANRYAIKDSTGGTDTHFGNTNLTQTADRTYTGAGYGYGLTGLGDWDFNFNTGKALTIRNGFFNKLILDPVSGLYVLGDIGGENNEAFIQLDAINSTFKTRILGYENIVAGGNYITISGKGNITWYESAIDFLMDSMRVRPFNGIINIDSLQTTSDTINFKPTVWNPTTGSFRKFNYWPGGGGSTTLTSVGGGLDIQTGGAGNVRTLNTGEFDQATDLISLKTGGVAYSKLNLSNSIVAGDITSNAVTTAKINSNAVDGTKIALGSDAQGDVMYYNGTDWVRLPAGTNGQVLKTQGAGANPIWENISTIANSESWYQYYVDIGGGATANLNINVSGTGAALVRAAMPADGWLLGMEYNTGTTSTGYVYSHSGNSGAVAPISFDSTNRFSYKSIIRFEDTSTSTETFVFQSGFADHHITESSIVDGAWFWYTSTDSSGKFVCKTRSNSTTTAVASSITVMPDTDYILEISEKGGHAYFYINKVQVADISTNVPIGLARATALCHLMKKTNGTTARKLYTQMYAYGKTAN